MIHFLEKLKFLLKNNNAIKKIYYKNSTNKYYMTANASLNLSSETQKKKKQIEEDLKILIKKHINSPEKLIQKMKAEGIKVYKVKNADKILAKIGEEEGFLTPLQGFKALIINLMTGMTIKEKFNFKTNEMFIFQSGDTEIYTIARALHKYNGFKNNLPGFDAKSQKIYKKVYKRSKNFSSPFSGCSIEDMYSCKEAISRDLEAINFTIDLSVEYERAKKVLNKIKKESSTNI